MNIVKEKYCSACKMPFNCGDTLEGEKCWCNNFPAIFNALDSADCLCPSCFTKACSNKIDEFVATITPETAIGNKASLLPETANIIEGIDYYFKDGNYVLNLGFISTRILLQKRLHALPLLEQLTYEIFKIKNT